MRCPLPALLRLLAALVAVPGVIQAQELPGTTGGELPAPLRDLYEQRGIRPMPPPAPGGQIAIPARREAPPFYLVPEIRVSSGYSDNIFITPDVLGFRPESDGLMSISPRLRALFRFARGFGLVGEYNLNYTQFFSNGHSVQNAGTLFLGYRPSVDSHAELGVRGGVARVSQFEDSDVNEGHVFLSGTYPLNTVLSASGTGSVGLREFPDRTRADARELVIGIPPITVPVGTEVDVDRGDRDVVTNIGGSLAFAYIPTGALRFGYDFTKNNSDFSELDYDSHRLSAAAVNVWRSWLSTQLAYSLISRRFAHALAADELRERDDAIHDLTVSAFFTPRFLAALPFSRSGTIRLDYDLLASRSNVSSGKFDRNFVSLSLEIGLRPITTEHLERWLPGGKAPPPSS